MKKKYILCSACLLGVGCRYDGRSKENKRVTALIGGDEILIPVCPEILGGLGIPRPSAEARGGRVFDCDGRELTKSFVIGAQEVLKIAKTFGAKEAILKQRSPSCGSGQLKMLNGEVVNGDGITAGLLKCSGIKVSSEEDL